MTQTDRAREQYDQRYEDSSYYWTTRPSNTCFEVLKREGAIRDVLGRLL